MNILHTDPKIYVIDDFLSSEECNHIIDVAKENFKPAMVAGDKQGLLSKGRTGQNCWIKHNTDSKIQEIVEKIAQIAEYPIENAESIQAIYYNQNQEYRRHYDAWKFDGSDKSKRCLLRGGQRIITALVYLNDVELGGETEFVRLNIKIKPKMGRLLVFHNCKENTNIVHELSEHSGTPVIKGEKYAFNLWFRQQDRKIEFTY